MGYYTYYRSKLSSKNQCIYDEVLTNLKSSIFSFDINIPYFDCTSIFTESILLDHPEIFFLNNIISISGNSNFIHFEFKRTINSPETKLISKNISQEISKNFSALKNKTIYEKVSGVFEWFQQNVTYSKDTKNCGNIIGAICEHRASCQGISLASKLIFDFLKVNSIVVKGSLKDKNLKENHAWLMVEIDNAFYHLDITNCLDGLHTFFCVPTREIMNDYFYDIDFYPCCNSLAFNYYEKNNFLVNFNHAFLSNFFSKNRIKRGDSLEFQLSNTDFSDYSNELVKYAQKFNRSLFPTKFLIFYNLEHQVYKIKRI